MGSKPTFLSTIGARLKAFFIKAQPVLNEATQLSVAATPIVDAALIGAGHPEAVLLYNTVSASVMKAEVAAAAAGAQTGTGLQKTAAVISDPDVQAGFNTFESAVGVSQHTLDQQKAYVAAVAQTVNLLNQTPTAQ